MKKYFQKFSTLIFILAVGLVFQLSTLVYSGINDRFSNIELEEDNYISFPEIATAPATPITGTGVVSVRANSIYFKDDLGVETSMIAAAGGVTDLDGAYAGGQTIDLDASGDIELDLTVAARKVQIANTFAGAQAVALEIDAEVAQEITDAILFNTTAGTIVDGIDASDVGITNALNAGANVIIGTTTQIDFTDFDVSADGAITIASDTDNTMIDLAPSVATAIAIDASDTDISTAISVGANDIVGTTGLINYTNFDVDAAGNVVSAGNVSCVDVNASGDVNVTGTFKQDALSAVTADTTLTIDGTGTGGVAIGTVAGTGAITMGGVSTEVNLPATVDLVLAGGDLSITDTANSDLITLVNNTMTSADIFDITAGGTRTSGAVMKVTDSTTTADIISVTADTQTSGDFIFYSNNGAAFTGSGLYMDITDGAGFTGYYLRMYDGGADDFSVKRYGATTIGGVANTDMLTVTTGHIQIDDGMIEVDTNEDHESNVTRAFAGAGTGAAFAVVDSNAATTNSALSVTSGGTAGTGATITNSGTGAATGLAIVHSGDSSSINISAGAARTGDVITIPMANQLAEMALNIDGAWTGTAAEGLIDLYSSATVTATASLLRIDNDTAQAADGSDGFCVNVDDDTLVATTPNVYAVLIDSNANEALHVATGKALFDEQATFTLGVDSNSTVDVDLSANTETVSITADVADYPAGTGTLTIYDDSTGQTNESFLLRLAREASADPQDAFLLCQDNSTGAAGNGTTVFEIGVGGGIAMAGSLDINGATLVGTGDTTLVGFANTVTVSSGATVTVTETNSCTVFHNDQAAEFDLPADPTGIKLTFVVNHASQLHIDPNGTDIINYAGLSAGDRLLSSTVGDTITLFGLDAGTWIVQSVVAGDGSFADTVWTDAN